MTKDELLSVVDGVYVGDVSREQMSDAVDKYTSAIIEQSKCCALLPVENVTRVEVIDNNGRSYVSWDRRNKVEVQLQDNERTLKVFVSKRQ